MVTLDSYNQILAFAGEEPISDLSTASYAAGLIASQFGVIKRRVLSLGFSFNTDAVTLPLNGDNEVSIPSDYIKVRFPAGMDNLVVRYAKVYDRTTGAPYAQSVRALVTRDIAFDSIPEPFQQWITLEVAADFRIRLNGLDNVAIYLKQQATRAKAVGLNSEPSNASGATGWGDTVAGYGA